MWRFLLRSSGRLVVAAVVAGCGRSEDVLSTERVLRLESSAFHTLAVDSLGRFWLGRPGALEVRDTSGATRVAATTGAATPSVLGWMGGRAYARLGDTVLAVSPDTNSAAARGGMGRNPLVLDVRARHLFQAARSGAVLAHDPATLAPVGGWAALGLPSTALAASPEGDRLYQGVGYGEAAPRLLSRDLQTGRILGTASFSAPFVALAAGASGDLFGVVVEDGRGAVMALRPRRGQMEVRWRTSLDDLGLDNPSELRLGSRERRVAVLARGNEAGLRLLDAETGSVLGSAPEGMLDASFGAGDALFLLYPGEIRVVR